MQYNEDEMQWESTIDLDGHKIPIAICNDYHVAEINDIASETAGWIRDHYPDILNTVRDGFLSRLNHRRRFREQPELEAGQYLESLKPVSVYVMEEKAFELELDDGGESGNSWLGVYVGINGDISPPELDDWEEDRRIRGETVNVSLCSAYEPEEIEDAIRRVEAVINERWHDVESVCAEHLLPLYNDKWRTEDKPEMGRREFLARLQLSSIHIMEDCAFDLYFLDNLMFGGYYVEIFMDSDGTLYEPSLYS